MKLSREERLGIALAVENSSEELNLNEKDRKLLRKISKYIETFSLSQYEVEEIRKELIGISEQARLRGETLEAAIGMPYKTFCNELVTAVADIRIPEKWAALRITGTMMYIMGILLLLSAFVFFLSFLIVWIGGSSYAIRFEQTLGAPWSYAYYLFVVALVEGILYFYGGKKGRYQCGDAKAAKKCFWCGIGWLVLLAIAIICRTILYVHVWKIRTMAELLAIENNTDSIIIVVVMLIYTIAARINMKAGREGA